MKTAMKVLKKVAAALKNSQKTKKRLKRQEKQLQAIVSQRLHLPRREPMCEEWKTIYWRRRWRVLFLSPVNLLSFNSSLIITQLFRFHYCSRLRFRRPRSNFALTAVKTNPAARLFFDLRFPSTLTSLKSRSSTKCIYAFFSTSPPILVWC